MNLSDTTQMASAGGGTLARLRAYAPYLLAVLLFGLGTYALYRLLAPVDINAVAAQIRSTPRHLVALALGSTFAGYLCLAAYDWSALSHIGKPLPLPVTISGGFLAYAFGNTIGLTAVSGGAVRWRLYSGLGLDGYDIAAVSTFTAVAFGVAATLVGLGALAVHPMALASVLPFQTSSVRLLAITAILVILGPLVWASVTRRRLKVGRFELQAPSPGLLATQLLISLGDITFSALTLYLLLPAGGPGFLTFVAIFAAATMAGVVSHVPGGVGVFETIVIAALPASVGVDKIAAALLLYRLIYFLVPFALALVLMAAFESWRALGGTTRNSGMSRLFAATEPAFRAIEPTAPILLAIMVFGSGMWMSLSALLPPVSQTTEAAEALFPLAFVEGSTLLTSALGALLIVLSLGLARRSLGAFWLTIGAMLAGAIVALLQRTEMEQAVTLIVAVLILLPFRRAFHRRSVLTHGAMTPGWAALLLAAILSVSFVLFYAHKSIPYAHELWWQFAIDANAPRALRSGLLISLFIGAGSLLFLLRAPRFQPQPPDTGTLEAARRIAMASDQPDAGFALTGDKAIMLSDGGDALVMFGVSGGSWLAYGGPVGEPVGAQEVGFRFVDAARRAGARPVFYEIGPESVPLMLELGMVMHKMGEEAVVDLSRFTLDGAARKKLRAAHARAGRDGLSLEIVSPPHDDGLLSQLRQTSDEWLTAKNAREKGFSVGRFEDEWLNRWPIAVVRQGDRVVAFANLMTTDSRRTCSIDLMRHSDAAPGGTMEFLFTELMLQLKAQGFARFSLGMAPLSGLEPDRSGRLWDRFGNMIYRHGGSFYNFEGLRAFKAKFDPDWLPHYLATPSGLPPLKPLADAAMLISRDRPQR
ncbi:phosphatidylglycerol lysyltransferase [Paracoccus aminovorans]|uniref:Phosphatidylglycerol lysyltransferase n=1 Tax=Paracoccus aminovorans TaxID=34004 RepID=A0A1I3E2Z8_9RHOB|nr:bifunctional lysylphosphatidylglycerol flippase/synthetase MprF [Paracoccus aminovorans]CQR84649.1 putative membrane protein [Paracoccus aminovorans]SFH93208.1 phosphatidylglycerol lysyltransferase [Paracoccus aminovorans]